MQKELELNFDLPEPKPFRVRFDARMKARPGINSGVVLARMNERKQSEPKSTVEPIPNLLVFESQVVQQPVSSSV